MAASRRSPPAPAWQALAGASRGRSRTCTCGSCSPTIPGAASASSPKAAGLYLDYSKNRITDETLRAAAAARRGARRGGRSATRCSAARRSTSPKSRAVLHVALRAPRDAVIEVDGHDVVPEVHAVLDRMAAFAERVRSGAWNGHTGKRIRNVVNIGIGGSYLGPEMAYGRCATTATATLTFRFVSNVDGTDFTEATHDLDAGRDAVRRLPRRPSRRSRR